MVTGSPRSTWCGRGERMVIFAFVDGRTDAILIPSMEGTTNASTRAATASTPTPQPPAGRPRAPEDARVPDSDGGQGEPGTCKEQERLDDVLPQRVPACMGENVHQALSMK
jgi:hypothetical protein